MIITNLSVLVGCWWELVELKGGEDSNDDDYDQKDDDISKNNDDNDDISKINDDNNKPKNNDDNDDKKDDDSSKNNDEYDDNDDDDDDDDDNDNDDKTNLFVLVGCWWELVGLEGREGDLNQVQDLFLFLTSLICPLVKIEIDQTKQPENATFVQIVQTIW